MKLFRIIISFLIVFLFWSCQSNKRHIPDFSDNIDYCYKTTVYSILDKKKEIYSYDYYDKHDNLIESVGFERRTKFIYDSIGHLQEKFICRMYNCEVGFRQIFIKDDFGNIMGIHNTREKELDLDTIDFKQTKFYNEKNQLIRELTYSNTGSDGVYFEYWKHYTYETNRIISDIEMFNNNDTIWSGKYLYDDFGNLTSIIYTNKGSVKTKTFEYDQCGNLIKETIEKDKHLLAKDVSFCVDNNTTAYVYDDNKRLVEKTRYNHKSEVWNKFIYEYEDKLLPK